MSHPAPLGAFKKSPQRPAPPNQVCPVCPVCTRVHWHPMGLAGCVRCELAIVLGWMRRRCYYTGPVRFEGAVPL